jgi:hypothetical protein
MIRRQRGGQQQVEAAALALLGQARRGRDAQQQQPGGDLHAAEHCGPVAGARTETLELGFPVTPG